MSHSAKEKARAYHKAYYQRNRERTIQRTRLYKLTHREKMAQWFKEYYQSHKQVYAERQKRYLLKDPEIFIQRRRDWYLRNKEKKDAQNKEWSLNNHDKVNRIASRRRARMRNAEGDYSVEQWRELKEIYNHTCPQCFRSEPEIKLTIDHKTPLVRGGTNHIDNIQPLCFSCNASKGRKIWFASYPINHKQYANARIC